MKILIFYGWSVRSLGGAEISVRQLAEALVWSGHTVGIIDVFNAAPDESVRISTPYWSVPRVAVPGGVRSGLKFLRVISQVRSILEEFQPDLVSVQCPVLQCHILVSALIGRRTPVVVTVRGNDIRGLPLDHPTMKNWQARLLERANAVTAVSQSLLQDLLTIYPSVRGKSRVIHNTVDRSWFQSCSASESSKRYVLFVGRLHPVKGVDLLLKAWSLIREQLSGIELWIVGGGDQQESLSILSQELGINGSVRFTGTKSPSELLSVYREAVAVVMPSRNEGLPRVSLEAGACGTIRVATRVGGIPETIVDGENGILVEPESPSALAQGLVRAVHLTAIDRQRMSSQAKNCIMQNFCPETMIARYEEVFSSVL